MSSLLTAGATAGLVAVAATLPAWMAAAVGAAWAVLEQQGSTRVVIVPAANTSKVSEEEIRDAKQVEPVLEERASLDPHWAPSSPLAQDREGEKARA